MNAVMNGQFQVKVVTRLPPGLFGESAVVVTATMISGDRMVGESIVLTQRPEPALSILRLEFPANLPEGLDGIDLEFVIKEALQQAEIDLLLKLETRAIELDRPDLAYCPFELRNNGSLVGYWLRGVFRKQIEELSDQTICPALKTFLKLVIRT